MLSALVALCAAAAPELPRSFIDTNARTQPGATLTVQAGGDLQQALDAAQPGDTVVLAAGATFTGPFTLPNKSGAEWIVVKSSDEANLPACRRVGPGDAPRMAKLVAPAGGSVLVTAAGAHHWRFVGLELTAAGFVYNLVVLGNGETSAASLPHDFVFERCWAHGHATAGTRRGIALNANGVAVIDSYFSQFAEVGADSQALAGWNGAGPFKIVNNHLEGAGENVLFGGADPSVPGLVPADIEVRGNHLFKPLSWKVGDPTYAGIHWSVKNLLEFKNARRVLVEGNVLENNWADAQVGMGVLLTPRDQDGTCPACGVQDVTLRRNVVRNSHGGLNIAGTDDLEVSTQTARVLVEDNLFEGVTYRVFQFLNSTGAAPTNTPGGVIELTVTHNTARVNGNSFATLGDSMAMRDQHQGFVFRDNITEHATYGFFGGGVGEGTAALNTYCAAGWVMIGNVIAGGGTLSAYPAGNFFPADLAAVGFADVDAAIYRLAPTSPFHGSVDPGVDFDALTAATATAISGAASCAMPPDAGVPDAGSVDAGSVADAGAPDAGTTAADAGFAPADGGSMPGTQGSCGCGTSPALPLTAFALLVVAAWRRRACCRPSPSLVMRRPARAA